MDELRGPDALEVSKHTVVAPFSTGGLTSCSTTDRVRCWCTVDRPAGQSFKKKGSAKLEKERTDAYSKFQQAVAAGAELSGPAVFVGRLMSMVLGIVGQG